MPTPHLSTPPAREPAAAPDFLLGDRWFVQPSVYRIDGPDGPHQVGPKVMHVLVCLAEMAGEVVPRERLMDIVWAETFVVEEALTRCVSELRKIFGDDPHNPRTIETIRNVGYRLVAPVTHDAAVSAGDGAAHYQGASVAGLRKSSRTLLSGKNSFVVAAVVVALAMVAGIVAVQSRSQGTDERIVPLQPTPVTTYPGEERDADLSPDGRQIAFTWAGQNGANVDVYVTTAGPEPPVRVTNHPALDISPAWSPDGERIAFIRLDTAGGCMIMVTSADGAAERPIDSCRGHRIADLSWSHNGEWLAYSGRDGNDMPNRIVLLSPETLERRILTNPRTNRYGDSNPSFSPDDRDVAFARRHSAETSDLYIVSLASGAEKRLTFDNRIIRGLDWTPNSREVVFSSNRSGTFNLWRIRREGGAPEWLAMAGVSQAQHPSLAQTDDRMIFEQVANEVNIQEVALAPRPASAEAKPLIVSTHVDVMPAYAPDNRRIAFISDRGGSFQLWIADGDGANPILATGSKESISSDPNWSPDGTKIAFSSLSREQGDIYVLEVASGRLNQLTSAESDDWMPRWSQDGRHIYFASDRSGSWQIWKRAIVGGEPVQVTRRGGRAASESLDGRHLFFARDDTAGIWRMPVDGGPDTLLFDRPARYDWASWTVADDGIYFIDRSNPKAAVSFFAFKTGEVTAIASIPSSALRNITRGIPSLSVSPDRRRIAYAQFDEKERDIVMVQLASRPVR